MKMSWSSTLALNREENKDNRPVVGLRLTEETLAALRRGDSCTLAFEQVRLVASVVTVMLLYHELQNNDQFSFNQ